MGGGGGGAGEMLSAAPLLLQVLRGGGCIFGVRKSYFQGGGEGSHKDGGPNFGGGGGPFGGLEVLFWGVGIPFLGWRRSHRKVGGSFLGWGGFQFCGERSHRNVGVPRGGGSPILGLRGVPFWGCPHFGGGHSPLCAPPAPI